MELRIHLALWVVACLTSSCRSAENERCPGTPQCICKWSGGKRMADCSNAGNLPFPGTYPSKKLQIFVIYKYL
jgi:hypothetical protein